MPFLAHIGELRNRLFVVFGALTLATLVAYFFTDQIFAFLLKPVLPFVKGGMPVTLGFLDPMTVRFGLSFWTAVVVCSPIIAWQLLGFLMPALKPNERRWILPTFAAMVVLFIAGVALCYTIILSASFQWLADQAGAIMSFMPQAGDTLTVVEFFLLGFGIAFQTPVIVFYLVFFGVIPYRKLRESWRIVYVTITILAAMITPDWSPVSMGALAIAMVVLYEMSLLACRVVLRKKIREQDAAALASEAA